MRLLISFLFLLILSSSAWATNWYVRDGGGAYGATSTTCNGLYNVAYVANAGPNCAVSNPGFILGWGCNSSGTCDSGTVPMQASDTLYIDGDSDTTPGTQAQYPIGYSGLTTGTIWYDTYNHCQGTPASNCTLGEVPGGSNGSPTSVIGTGTHKPQLWGTDGVYKLFLADNGYTTLQWLELTQHYACGHANATQPCSGANAYVGNDGLSITGAGIILTDVYVHGISTTGIGTGALTNPVFTRVWVIGNAFAGFSVGESGSVAMTGTLTFNQPIVEWNGCVEQYPLTYSGIDNPLNYANCYGAANGGYGDGLPFAATGSEAPGNWTLIGPGSISWNTQDGLDMRHGTAGAVIQIDKMRFEGNGGQQIKLTAANDYVTNSLIVGDCGWWYGAAQTETGAMKPDVSFIGGDSCRAGGNAVSFNAISGGSVNIYNNTIFTEAIAFENYESSCDSTAHVNLTNNIIQGGKGWSNNLANDPTSDNNSTTYYYDDDCNPTVTSTYNIVYGNKNANSPCGGTGDLCGTSPGFSAGIFPNGTSTPGSGATMNIVASAGQVTSGTIVSGGTGYTVGDGLVPNQSQSGGPGALFTVTTVGGSGAITGISMLYGGNPSGGSQSNYTTANGLSTSTGVGQYAWYNAWSGVSLLPIATNSGAKGTGVTGLTYWNTSNDYYNVTRASPPSMGGLEYASCAANTFAPCFFNSDCCGSSCVANVCAGAAPPSSSATGQWYGRLVGSVQ